MRIYEREVTMTKDAIGYTDVVKKLSRARVISPMFEMAGECTVPRDYFREGSNETSCERWWQA